MSSKTYFDTNATKWDNMRASFFSESVREIAYKLSGIKAGDIAGDIGAGTGFVTEGLLSLGSKVIAIDESEEMLAVLENLLNSTNLKTIVGESKALPIEDNSLDYVFANMYLHHTEEPDKAIAEMYRVLKPRGKIIISDLSAHHYDFLRTEHHDRWLGFDQSDIYHWFKVTGFKPIAISLYNESCKTTAEPCGCNCHEDSVNIPIFFATGVK